MILGVSYLEFAACLMTAVCIFLAGRNNIHTWWTGIVACILFGALFYQAKLYADVTLQGFFIVTGILGWIGWRNQFGPKPKLVGDAKYIPAPLPITKADARTLLIMLTVAVWVAAVYGTILHSYTDAYAPWIDSLVLTLSVVGQLLLMRKNVQTWPTWVLVNTLSVPLYLSRELYLTAGMYALFWINAIWSWYSWSKQVQPTHEYDEYFA